MLPEIHIGPLDLRTFGLCFALAFVASGLTVSRRLRELGKPHDWVYEMVFAALIGGLIGSRLDYLIQNWSEVSDDLLGNIFSGSGLVFFGGLVGGAVGVLIWAAWRGWLGWQLCDACVVPLIVGYAVGRIGCQLSGDGDYGIESDLPWAMAYPDGTVPTTEEVHPTPIYETLSMGLGALVLWRLRDRFPEGVLFGLYLILTGGERFLVEIIRRNDSVVAGLTQPQLISLALLALGVAIVIVRRKAPACARVGTIAPRAAAAQRQGHRGAGGAARVERDLQAHEARQHRHQRAAEHRPAGGVRVSAHGHRRRHESRQHQEGAEPLHGHGDRDCQQQEQCHAHEQRAESERRGAFAVEGEGLERAVQRGQHEHAEAEQGCRSHRVRVGHPQWIAEQQLGQALGRVRREGQQRAEPDQPGHRDRGTGIRADSLVPRGQRDHQRGGQRPRGRAQQERGPGQRGQHEPGQEPVCERLGGIGQPLCDHPEAERAAERARERDLGESAAIDSGPQRIEQEVEDLHQLPCPCSWCWTVTARPSASTMISLP